MGEEQQRAVFRLPSGLRRTLQDAASASGRSMNRQAIHYLSQGLRLDGYTVPKAKKNNAPRAGTREASSV